MLCLCPSRLLLYDAMLTLTRYFPYSRQSKKKSHRGAITARMLANLLSIAGVDHVITMDLHVRRVPVSSFGFHVLPAVEGIVGQLMETDG